MFFKKVLLSLIVITTLKLNCAETAVPAFECASLRHSVACQTSQEDFSLAPKNNALFVRGDFNPEYKFSKTEIAQLALLQLAITIDSVTTILGSIAYNTGTFALNLATTLWKIR